MFARIAAGVAISLVLVFAGSACAAGPKLGFAVDVEGEGFFLNPVVTKILVTEVTKGSPAEAAGMKAGDIILRINGESLVGKRAFELRHWMEFKPGETRIMRVKHPDGTEFDAKESSG